MSEWRVVIDELHIYQLIVEAEYQEDAADLALKEFEAGKGVLIEVGKPDVADVGEYLEDYTFHID